MSAVTEEVKHTYVDVENPLHEGGGGTNDYKSPSLSKKAVLDGHIRPSDSGESKKREKPPTDFSGYYAVLLMFIVGCFSGVLVNVVLWASSMLSLMQAKLIESNPAGPFCFMLTMGALCGLSAYVCKKSGRVAVLGSGIPEVKALLTNDFHPTELAMIVSSRIGYTRMVALVMSLGSGLSIGSAAPLVHMTVCNAYTIMKLSPDFGCLLENSTMMRQIFNASAAAGMAACFNCPLGGVLFSIEVTSSYYMMANYWRSFMAATAGAVLFSMILWWRRIEDSRPFPMEYVANPYAHWEFPLFFFLGVVGGLSAFVYLKMQQMWFLFVRKYNVAYPVAIAAGVGAFSALMIWAVGSYTAKGVTCATVMNDLLKSGDASELRKYPNVSRIGGLFATLLIRWMLTIMATTLRIPAGFFTPMIMLGAIIGRIFGHCVQSIVGTTATIFIPGYALVGACAFASGTTHTISAAVVMLESTGELSMFLPCLIGAIVGSGVVKGYTVSLYNQGLINKGLESFEQLLLENGDFHSARDMMDPKAVYVTKNCQVGDLVALMEHGKLATFAVIDSVESCKLLGSISRKDVYQYLKRFYAKHALVAFVRQTLPEDTKQDDYRIARKRKMEARTQWLRTQMVKSDELEDEAALNAAAAAGGGGLLNVLTGSTHGHSEAAGNSAAQHAALPRVNSVNSLTDGQGHNSPRAGSIYSSEESGGEEDEAEAQDDYDPRASLTRGDYASSSSSTTIGKELTSVVRRMSLGGPHDQPPHREEAAGPPMPTSIQIQALLDAQKAGPLPPPVEVGSPSAKGNNRSSGMLPRSLSATGSLGNPLESVVGRVSSVMQSKKKMRESLAYMSKEQEGYAQLLLKHTIDITREALLPLNVDPFMVHSTSPVDQVYMLFNSVKVNCVFVVEGDQVLQGMISQAHLMSRLKKKN